MKGLGAGKTEGIWAPGRVDALGVRAHSLQDSPDGVAWGRESPAARDSSTRAARG